MTVPSSSSITGKHWRRTLDWLELTDFIIAKPRTVSEEQNNKNNLLKACNTTQLDEGDTSPEVSSQTWLFLPTLL